MKRLVKIDIGFHGEVDINELVIIKETAKQLQYDVGSIINKANLKTDMALTTGYGIYYCYEEDIEHVLKNAIDKAKQRATRALEEAERYTANASSIESFLEIRKVKENGKTSK